MSETTVRRECEPSWAPTTLATSTESRLGLRFASDASAYLSTKSLRRDAGALTRHRDDVLRVGAEDAIQDFVRRYRHGEEEAHRSPLVADDRRRHVEFRDDLIDRLLGQLGQVPLSEVVRQIRSGIHGVHGSDEWVPVESGVSLFRWLDEFGEQGTHLFGGVGIFDR